MTICPDSEEVLPADADRGAWLEARREGLGGSDASAIAGVNEFTSLYEVWLDKTGRGTPKRYTPEMRFGHLIEDDARQVFTEDTGIGVSLAGLQRSKARPWQQHTPDGITSDGGLLEIKSVGWRQAHHWDDGQVADHAEVQVQHGMAVTGLSHAWVVAVIEREFVFRRVERSLPFVDLITDMERDFWERHVLADEEPAMVAADLDLVRARYPRATQGAPSVVDCAWLDEQVDSWRRADEALKAAKDARARIEAELTAAIGDAESVGVCGDDGQTRVYATRKNYHRAGYTVAPTDYRRLTVLARPRKES